MKRVCILIVEDNDECHWAMSSQLHQAGYYTAWATNGRKALEFLRQAPLPDLILLDLHMPDMDGATFIRHKVADQRLRDIPVLLQSSHPLLSDIARKLSVDGHISKFDIFHALEDKVRQLVPSPVSRGKG